MVTAYEKGRSSPPPDLIYVDYGLSLWHRAVVEHRVPVGTPVDLARIFTDLSRDGLLSGYEVADRFYEIGSPAGLRQLDALLRAGDLAGSGPTDPEPT
jgi:NDP-sugar pyrophosphorylase family protein